MSASPQDLADELKKIMRLAGRRWEALEEELPGLSDFYLVTRAAGALDELARITFILHELIPVYLSRLPTGRNGLAIRELLTWEDKDGEPQPLTTRYHRAAAHLVNPPTDFGRRQEPKLLLECARRFIVLDQQDRSAGRPPAPVLAEATTDRSSAGLGLPAEDAAGIVRVHQNLDYRLLSNYIAQGEKISILNTWIPELDILAHDLIAALTRGAYVSILMLYPDSDIAQLRSQALLDPKQAFNENRVGPGVRHCLRVLADIGRAVDENARRHLRVRLYNSLPSISVYSVDDRSLVSVFLHGQLAVNSVQIEVEGQYSLMGRLAFDELAILWEIAQPFKDLEQWRTELENMRPRFGFQP